MPGSYQAPTKGAPEWPEQRASRRPLGAPARCLGIALNARANVAAMLSRQAASWGQPLRGTDVVSIHASSSGHREASVIGRRSGVDQLDAIKRAGQVGGRDGIQNERSSTQTIYGGLLTRIRRASGDPAVVLDVLRYGPETNPSP
jgi:hypothetical protein